jgi:hypothetical protein
VADDPFSGMVGTHPLTRRAFSGPRLMSDSHDPVAWAAMSKRTVKRKIRSKKKANHGKRPNCGRG